MDAEADSLRYRVTIQNLRRLSKNVSPDASRDDAKINADLVYGVPCHRMGAVQRA